MVGMIFQEMRNDKLKTCQFVYFQVVHENKGERMNYSVLEEIQMFQEKKDLENI